MFFHRCQATAGIYVKISDSTLSMSTRGQPSEMVFGHTQTQPCRECAKTAVLCGIVANNRGVAKDTPVVDLIGEHPCRQAAPSANRRTPRIARYFVLCLSPFYLDLSPNQLVPARNHTFPLQIYSIDMTSDKQQIVLALVFGLAAIVVALLSLLVGVLQLVNTRQAQGRLPAITLQRMQH